MVFGSRVSSHGPQYAASTCNRDPTGQSGSYSSRRKTPFSGAKGAGEVGSTSANCRFWDPNKSEPGTPPCLIQTGRGPSSDLGAGDGTLGKVVLATTACLLQTGMSGTTTLPSPPPSGLGLHWASWELLLWCWGRSSTSTSTRTNSYLAVASYEFVGANAF